MIQIRYRIDLKFCGEEKDDNPPFPSLEGVPVPNGIVLFTTKLKVGTIPNLYHDYIAIQNFASEPFS